MDIPITPASEITEAAALYMPQVGGVFLQAESEVAAINMLYGASSAGIRCMTASSGPGISLMQEGVSYMAGAELPCVIADIARGGPGLGNIAAEQSDYHQVVKGGGNGNYRALVLAPYSAQEMVDLTATAFDLADRYRNPVYVLADGFVGQMMEPVEFPKHAILPEPPDWAVLGNAASRGNFITSLHMECNALEAHNNAPRGQVPPGGNRGASRRRVANGRRRNRAGGLRHRGPHPQGRYRRGPRRGHSRGSAAPHHALSLPDPGLPAHGRAGAPVRRG